MWKELKAIDSKKLKIKICELMIACYSDNFTDAYQAKADMFLWIDKICNDRDDALREVDFLSGQLEAANNDLRLTQIRLENLKKYGAENPDIRDMYPSFEYHDNDSTEAIRHAKQHLSEIYGKDITEGDRLDPADYADLPFPDVEDLAPAEEVEGSEE